MYALEDNLLLKGAEYTAKFNLNETVPYDPKFFRCEAVLVNGPWDGISENKKGFNSPMWDIIYFQYHVKRGIQTPWTEKARAAYGPERHFTGADQSSWGDLVWS